MDITGGDLAFRVDWDVPEEMGYDDLLNWLRMFIGPYAEDVVQEIKDHGEQSMRWEDDGGAFWAARCEPHNGADSDRS